MNTQIDISTLDETQTKAAVYDHLAVIENANNIIRALNDHIVALRQPPEAPVLPLEDISTAEAINVPAVEEAPAEPTSIDEQPVTEAAA